MRECPTFSHSAVFQQLLIGGVEKVFNFEKGKVIFVCAGPCMASFYCYVLAALANKLKSEVTGPAKPILSSPFKNIISFRSFSTIAILPV